MGRKNTFFGRYKGVDRTAKPDPLWYKTHPKKKKGKRVKYKTEWRH